MPFFLRSLSQRSSRNLLQLNLPGVKRSVSSYGPSYCCEIECESLERYKPGGYHPVNIGDKFKSGRYKIVQKLGWGGYSTVWLAYDCTLSRLAAVKVVVAEISNTRNEVRVLKQLASFSAEQKGLRHLRKLQDHFLLDGPNGRHQCLVFEVEGVNVQTLINHYGGGTRLPGRLAWELSKQITLGLHCLHTNGIAHADLYTGNILVSSEEQRYSNPSYLKDMKAPVREAINASFGHQITDRFPRWIVEPATLPIPSAKGRVCAKLIDYEQSFLTTDQELTIVRTPLIFRAPETLLDSKWNLSMDIWSLACTIFELVVGHPPFDSFMPTKAPLVLEWIAMFGNVPKDWKQRANMVIGDCKDEIDGGSLPSWLRETYFQSHKKADFSAEDIDCLGDLLTQMMRYRPEERLSTHAILKHQWFASCPFSG